VGRRPGSTSDRKQTVLVHSAGEVVGPLIPPDHQRANGAPHNILGVQKSWARARRRSGHGLSRFLGCARADLITLLHGQGGGIAGGAARGQCQWPRRWSEEEAWGKRWLREGRSGRERRGKVRSEGDGWEGGRMRGWGSIAFPTTQRYPDELPREEAEAVPRGAAPHRKSSVMLMPLSSTNDGGASPQLTMSATI